MSTEKEPTSLFTPAETKFVLAVLKNMEGGIKVRCFAHHKSPSSNQAPKSDLFLNIKFNKDAVAQELGMKDAGSVGARWNTIFRTKINGGTSASPPGSATKSNKKTKNVDVKEEPQTPATGKKRGRKPKATDEGDDTPSKPLKQARADSVDPEEGDADENGEKVKEEYLE
jgi:hypothetical protein